MSDRVSQRPFLAMGGGMALFLLGVTLGVAGALPIASALGLGAAAAAGMPAVWAVRRSRQRDPGWISGAAFCFVVAGGVALLAGDLGPGRGEAAPAVAALAALATGCVAAIGAGLYLAGHRAWHRSGWRLPG